MATATSAAQTPSAVWKPIPGYEGLYSVSDRGEVRNDRSGRILQHNVRTQYYPNVMLCKGGQTKRLKVHRLVALAFIGPNPKGLEINHKDGDRLNPHADNLEYVTRSQNARHRFYRAKHKTTEPISAIGLDYQLVKPPHGKRGITVVKEFHYPPGVQKTPALKEPEVTMAQLRHAAEGIAARLAAARSAQ
jgi:hypothetical protein